MCNSDHVVTDLRFLGGSFRAQPDHGQRRTEFAGVAMASRNAPKPLPSASLHLVLAILEGESHGYALMRRVEELSDGAVRMGPGTLYGTLNRLLADGLIIETTDDAPREDNERRRYYRLTGEGQQVAQRELARLHTLLSGLSGLQPGAAGG